MIYLLFLISLFSPAKGEEPLAVISGRKIYKKDVPDYRTLDSYLQTLVFFELAKEQGYVDEVREQVESQYEEKLIKELYQRITREAGVNRAEKRILYREKGREVKLRLIRVDDFKTAYEVWGKALTGGNFAELSEEYSTVVRLKNNRGDIGWIKWNYSPPLLSRIAFSMEEGEVSIPFYEKGGWNIIKMEDSRQIDLSSFEKMEKRLEKEIEGTKIKKLASRHLSYVKWILDVEIPRRGLDLLAERTPIPDRNKNNRPAFKPEDMDFVLARSNMGEYTVREFIDDIDNIRRLPPLRDRNRSRDFIRWRVMYDFLLKEAKKLGLHRIPRIENSFKENLILTAVKRWKAKEVQPQIQLDEGVLRKYYEENKEKYRIPEKRKTYAIEVGSKEEAVKIHSRLLQGADFETLAKAHSIGEAKKRGGLLGYLTRNKRGNIGDVAFTLKPGEISKPFKIEDGWAVIKVTDIKEKHIPEFKKVRYRVNQNYRKNKRIEIENEIYEENKDRLGLKILPAGREMVEKQEQEDKNE